jgi:hypothetical protein
MIHFGIPLKPTGLTADIIDSYRPPHKRETMKFAIIFVTVLVLGGCAGQRYGITVHHKDVSVRVDVNP